MRMINKDTILGNENIQDIMNIDLNDENSYLDFYREEFELTPLALILLIESGNILDYYFEVNSNRFKVCNYATNISGNRSVIVDCLVDGKLKTFECTTNTRIILSTEKYNLKQAVLKVKLFMNNNINQVPFILKAMNEYSGKLESMNAF